jgi:hypothetical protein
MGVNSTKLTRKLMSPDRFYLDGLPRSCGGLFLDSGAHTLYTNEVIQKGHSVGYAYYKSPEFKKYVRQYGEWCKAHEAELDFIVNVDVIFHPQLSWNVLKFLENEYGLHPVPVIHFGTDLKWIDKHLDAGYEFLGIGGLGQEATRNAYLKWADKVFDRLCSGPDRLPCVRTHGFAMTSYRLMIRYPWWSVDSASWAKAAGFGQIFVPHKRDGKFVFDVEPYVIGFSYRSELTKADGKHFLALTKGEQAVILEWLEIIGVPLGSTKKNGRMKEYGVLSQYHARAVACVKFFDQMTKWLPEWPWPFPKPIHHQGFFK